MRRILLSLTLGLVGVFFGFSAVHAETVSLVQGRALNADSQPVESMAVQLLDASQAQIGYTTTDSDGYFYFTDLAEGTYYFYFDPASSYDCSSCSLFDATTEEITVDFDLAVDGTQDFGDYTLETASRYITVHVTDQDDAPAPDVSINAWSEGGYAFGSTDENGEYAFGVSADNDSLWFISTYSESGYTSTFAHDVEAEADGETVVELSVQQTDAIIVATLKDADGNVVTLTNEQFGSVNCFETGSDDTEQTQEDGGGKDSSHSSGDTFFFGHINGGESSATINVVAGSYKCDAWIYGYGAKGAEVTVATDETGAIDINLIEYTATINFRYVDAKGNTLTDISSFSAYAYSMKDPEGNDYFQDGAFTQGEDGEATLQVLDGYTYQVGGWIQDHGSGSYGDGKGEGDSGDGGSGKGGDEDSGDGSGDGEHSGDDEYSDDEGDSGDFSEKGIYASSEGTEYIQDYEMVTVVGDEDNPQDVEVVLQIADATIKVTVLDENGDPEANAWVAAMQGDIKEKEGKDGKGGKGGHKGGWGNFVGGVTNDNGVAELSVASGKTYEVFAHTKDAFSGEVLPPPRETTTPKPGETVRLTMQSRTANWTLNLITVTDTGDDLDYSFCYGYSPTLGVENFAEMDGGEGSMGLVRGDDWYIGCMGYGNDTFYRSSDTLYTPGKQSGGSDDLEVTLTQAGDYFDETSYTFSETTNTTITLPDGESTLTIPANAVGDSGNGTLTVNTATDYKVSDDNFPIDAYEFSVIDSEGNAVTEFTSNLTLNLKYDESRLEDFGIDEEDLSGGAYSEDNNTWESPVSTIVDTDANTLTIVLDHFSTYGALGDKGLSSVNAVPNEPRQLVAKNITSTSALLSWKKPKSSTVKKYQVQVRKLKVKKQKQWDKFKNVKKLKKKAGGLLPGTAYQFRVRACNNTGCSAYTAWKKFTTVAE
ncbi:MAG: fibronectin type III domain-containing protein [Candidatus Kerfeldbacteria bacterium]|nr:fibronectin type III domain-containing protein [Candidatus Kerfeldbacteria bacterium]